ncbi:MAG: hypothetical protein CL481_05560 [Acidobacteria bacterium]|nr:hypothetical protein [Acidobacteriota bacterium]
MTSTAKGPFWMGTRWRLIGSVLLLGLMWRVGAGDVFRVVLGVDPLSLASGALLTMGVLFLRSWRWRILCGGFGIKFSVGDAIRLYLLGTFVSSIAPGRVGDFAKAYYLRERHPEAGLAVGIATVAYDRLLDLGQISALALGAIVVVPWVPEEIGPPVVFFGLTGFVISTAWRPVREGLMARPLNWALRRLPGEDDPLPSVPQTANVLAAQALTLASLIGLVGVSVVLSRGLSISIPAWRLAVLAALGALVSLIPVTTLGIGTRDSLYVSAAPFLGASSATMLGLSLLILSMYALKSIIGWVTWALSPVRDRQPPEL